MRLAPRSSNELGSGTAVVLAGVNEPDALRGPEGRKGMAAAAWKRRTGLWPRRWSVGIEIVV
jgi:hypothetical protein